MFRFRIIFLLVIIYSLFPRGMSNEEARKVIFDVDVGFDDYLGILIHLEAEKAGKVKVEAITCTYGLTDTDKVCKNVARLLDLAGRSDIPLYKGSKYPLIYPTKAIKRWDGEDGFGDLDHKTEPNMTNIKSIPAAIAMYELAKKYPKQISLIAEGPLTNIAIGQRLYDDFLSNFKDLWIMGGNYNGTGKINLETSATSEYNFYVDVEAAQIVLDSINIPTYLFSWEACIHPKLPFDRLYKLIQKRTKALELLENAIKNVKDFDKTFIGCDAYLAFIYLNPDKYITKKSTHQASVLMEPPEKKGQLQFDTNKSKQNITFIERFDFKAFKKCLSKLNM